MEGPTRIMSVMLTIMSWGSFVPDLLATFIGAALGIVGALRIERRRKRDDRTAEKERFDVRAKAVADSMERNANNVLAQWAALDESRAVSMDTLELSVWEIHREELARLAEDVSLITEVARWFESAESLAALHDYHRRQLIGIDQVRTTVSVRILADLQTGATALAEGAPPLIGQLRDLRSRPGLWPFY